MKAVADVTLKAAVSTLKGLRQYHSHDVYGLDKFPKTGPAVLAVNHGLATYDTWLVFPAIQEVVGRSIHGLLDRLIYQVPVMREVFSNIAYFAEGTRENALRLLSEGEVVGMAPGGMRESLLSSKHKYQVAWDGRRGFVRLSLLSGAPIVLGACPRSDDIFNIYDNPLTPWVYARLKMPAPIFRGWGPTLLPRPVKLWHLFSEPIYPDVPPDRVTDADVTAHHRRIVDRMQRLMYESLEIGA